MPMNPRLLVPRATFDADAAAYLRAVEAADGQVLETPVKRAVDDFFRGMKADGTFSAIKAACLLCGARTLAGALVPLAGNAPTNNNFVDADYNRETGLVGNGSTKYLDTNKNANTFDDDDYHHAVYVTQASNINSITMGYSTTGDTSYSQFFVNASSVLTLYTLGNAQVIGTASTTGLLGVSRSTLASFDWFAGTASGTRTQTATQTLADFDYFVLARNTNGTADTYSSTRAAFYSVGESLDLSLLDARVSALVTAIGAAL
jgi:hypothetical protein